MAHSFEGRMLYSADDVAEAAGLAVSVVLAIAAKWPRSGYRFQSNSLRPGRVVLVDLASLGDCQTFVDMLPADFRERLRTLDRLDSPSGTFEPLNEAEAAAARKKYGTTYPDLDFSKNQSPQRGIISDWEARDKSRGMRW